MQEIVYLVLLEAGVEDAEDYKPDDKSDF